MTLILSLMWILPAALHAAPVFIITFDVAAEVSEIEEIEGRVRALSIETGAGEVRMHPSHLRLTADMSKTAADRVRAMPGVSGVHPDLPMHTMTPSVRTADNIDRIITFETDLDQDRGRALHEAVRKLARETGSGYCELFANGALKANLSERATREIEAMEGIVKVEVAPGAATCRRTLDEP